MRVADVAGDLEAILERLYRDDQILDAFSRAVSDDAAWALFAAVAEAAALARRLELAGACPANEDDA